MNEFYDQALLEAAEALVWAFPNAEDEQLASMLWQRFPHSAQTCLEAVHMAR